MTIYEHTSGGQYLCSNCYQLYNTEIELQQHVCVTKRRNTKQVKEKKFKCETCGKLLSLKMNLKSHIRCVHEKIKQFPVCTVTTLLCNRLVLLFILTHVTLSRLTGTDTRDVE